MIKTKKEGVHTIEKDGQIIAMFKRDEESNKNLIYMVSEASLDEIDSLFVTEKKV